MRLDAALKFTFLTGVFQIGLGIFRLGAIVHYVSYPVMVACNSAGAFLSNPCCVGMSVWTHARSCARGHRRPAYWSAS
jgi:hypothetical protein